MEITGLFEIYLDRCNGEIDMAEDYFREAMKEDVRLKKEYQEWCDEMGYTDRKGFRVYFVNRNNPENLWDSFFNELKEYDELEIDYR